jgi:hypothetical protein
MHLARLHAPFDHPEWIFELKLDGFRAMAYIENGATRLVSRNRNTYKSFPMLTQAIGTTMPVSNAILDGEIVHLGPDGTPRFYDLMRRRGPQHFYAFDLTVVTCGTDRCSKGSARCARSCRLSRRPCCTWITSPAAEWNSSRRYACGTWKASWRSSRTRRTRPLPPPG